MEKRNKYLHFVYTYACHGRASRIKMHFQFPKNNCGVTAGFGRNVNLDTSNWAEIHYPVKLHPRGVREKHAVDYLIFCCRFLFLQMRGKGNLKENENSQGADSVQTNYSLVAYKINSFVWQILK